MSWKQPFDAPKREPFNWHVDMMSGEMAEYWLFLLRRMGVLWPDMRQMAPDLSERLKLACAISESPIEVRLIASLLTHNWGTSEKPFGLLVTKDFQEFVSGSAKAALMPQCDFGRYRFDFCLSVRRNGSPIFCAVEADGVAYHDKAKDAERDKWCAKMGIQTFRFTGREINHDAPACAARVDRALRKLEGIK